jgi:hypothetical protein
MRPNGSSAPLRRAPPPAQSRKIPSLPPENPSPLSRLQARRVSRAVRREVKQREHALPPVSVFRWWARRTSAVSGAVLDAVASKSPGRLLVCDPFAGGGTVAIEAALRGHRVYTQDIDPWAALGVATSLGLPTSAEIRRAADRLEASVSELIRKAYATTLSDGQEGWLSHTMRVATGPCPSCKKPKRLFPYALLSRTSRSDTPGRSAAWIACPSGHVFLASAARKTSCPKCQRATSPAVPSAVTTAGSRVP